MLHAESQNLRSNLQNKKTEILTQISVLKEEIAEMRISRIEESNFKKKLYSLKFSEATTKITCNTSDCHKKIDGIKQWTKHQRMHKDVLIKCKEYIDGKKCWFSTNTHLAMQLHLNRYTSTVI
jgi:hypothetical protein